MVTMAFSLARSESFRDALMRMLLQAARQGQTVVRIGPQEHIRAKTEEHNKAVREGKTGLRILIEAIQSMGYKVTVLVALKECCSCLQVSWAIE